jgi:hypothetical protein
MGILNTATTGRVKRPHLVLIYGPDGVGKSTFAASAPNPVFFGAESGTNELDVTRVQIKSFKDLTEGLDELCTQPHNFKTLVLDTLDWVEKLVVKQVFDTVKLPNGKTADGVEDYGYGKGRVYTFEAWQSLIPRLDAVRDHGLNILLLAHSMVKKFEDPQTPQGYDRFSLKLQDGAKTDVAALVREYVDFVGFVNYRTETSSEDTRRGFGGSERSLFTERRPAFDAKNRFGLPSELPFPKTGAWNVYAQAVDKCHARPEGPGFTAEALTALADQVTDQARRLKVMDAIKQAGTDPVKLASVHARLLALVSAGKEKAPAPVAPAAPAPATEAAAVSQGPADAVPSTI